MPKKNKIAITGKSAKSSPIRRTRDEIESIMKRMSDQLASGTTITDALKHLGISYSNYDYWSKKMGFQIPGVGRRGRKGGAGSGRKGTEENTLEAMLENRRERAKLESAVKRLKELDAEYQSLRKKLGR